MKKMLVTIIVALIISGGVFWSCQKDEIPGSQQETLMLKGGIIPNCSSVYQLITRNRDAVGELIVSNNNEYLSVEINSVGANTISEIHLWVGANQSGAPVNRQGIPVPGKFTYSDGGSNSYSYLIKLTDLYTPNVPGKCEEKELFIYAHAVISQPGQKEEITAWSEGVDFGTSRWGSYSTYMTCCKTGGGGCFPHKANVGENVDGVRYYNNVTGGKQDILADNGEVAGKAEYTSGKLVFYLDQSWMFSGTAPMVQITGYYEQNGTGTLLYSGEPTFPQGDPYVSISSYPYYSIQLNLQYCTTN